MKAGYYIVTILASLLGWGLGYILSSISLCYLTPVGILIAGLWAKDPKWWIHFIIVSLIAILPLMLLILGLGGLVLRDLESIPSLLTFGGGMILAPIAHILNFGGLIYSVVYIIIAGRRLPPHRLGALCPVILLGVIRGRHRLQGILAGISADLSAATATAGLSSAGTAATTASPFLNPGCL